METLIKLINYLLGILTIYLLFSLISWNIMWITEDMWYYWLMRIAAVCWAIWYTVED